jgi:uncharacterized repeat protein (TIGR02543 family)
LPIIAVLSLFIVSCSSPAGGGPETEPSSYTVTFKSGYGENETLYTKTVTPPAATVADFPGNPSRNGYAFTGWNTRENSGGTAFTASTTVNADITVYARWTVIPSGSYAVTFRMNDGTETVHAVKIVTPPADAVGAANFPDPPVRDGYTFAEWNTQPTGTGTPFTASTTVNGDITVYARWTVVAPPGSYTVTFRLNDGTGAVHETKTVTSPATTVGAANFPMDPTRNGYTFAGWNTQPNGSGTAFTDSTTVNTSLMVYALWNGTGAAITFLDPDDGDGAFDETGFTLSKTATGNPDNRTITITGEDYTNPRWLVDGTLKGTGTSLTIAAADYRTGPHYLSLLVTKNGVTWSRDIVFTVEN